MRKISYSLALAVLGIALLVGAASANGPTADVTVSGCLLDADIAITEPPTPEVSLPMRTGTEGTYTADGGDLVIESVKTFSVTVADQTAAHTGKLTTTGGTALTNTLVINEQALDANGQASLISNHGPVCTLTTPITYKQSVETTDNVAGAYSIPIQYILTATP